MSEVVEEGSTVSKQKKSSWIWQYFKEEVKEVIKGEETIKISVIRCQIKENPLSNICGTEYNRKDSSTGNAISHLRAKHNIIQSGKVSLN